jgi:zinc transporter, ZIP family
VRKLAAAFGLGLAVASAASALAVTRPWDRSPSVSGEVRVHHATLRTGEVDLVVVNESEEAARLAQVIVNDAYVDFRQSRRILRPGETDRITVSYPWITGESYEVRLMTSTGATIDYELEDAEAGTSGGSRRS